MLAKRGLTLVHAGTLGAAEQAYQLVRNRLELQQRRQKALYDRTTPVYGIGDLVWTHCPAAYVPNGSGEYDVGEGSMLYISLMRCSYNFFFHFRVEVLLDGARFFEMHGRRRNHWFNINALPSMHASDKVHNGYMLIDYTNISFVNRLDAVSPADAPYGGFNFRWNWAVCIPINTSRFSAWQVCKVLVRQPWHTIPHANKSLRYSIHCGFEWSGTSIEYIMW